MAEVSKPDYLSLVNKGGSGFNVSELVTSIVSAEIEPKRSLENSKKSTTENAISGIGFLNAQATTTKSQTDLHKKNTYFSLSTSNIVGVSIKSLDETKIQVGNRNISDVSIAKKMVFELGGFANLTSTYSSKLTISTGTWSQSSTASSDSTDTYSENQTYIVTGAVTVTESNAIRTNSDWTGGQLTTGDIFTVNDAVQNTSLASASLKKIDKFSFTAGADASVDVEFTNENLNQIASRLDAVSGISAKIIDTSGNGTNYSLVLTSDDTGGKNGFKIEKKAGSVESATRWLTADIPEKHKADNLVDNKFNQLASDAKFKLDGVSVTRTGNIITDLIEGTEIELKSDFSSPALISAARSESAVKATVEEFVSTLNSFKAEIDRLTFIDIDGENNGPLAMDPSVTSIKNKFKRLAVAPLYGYADTPIYLSQLGIKTDTTGKFYIDDATFKSTYSKSPDSFLALKDDNLKTNTQGNTARKSTFTKIDGATYVISETAGNYYINKDGADDSDKTSLLKTSYNGGLQLTSVKYPGLVIETASATPTSFKLYVGQSVAKKVSDLMDEILVTTSAVNQAKTRYETLKSDITERLQKLEVREKLITTQYTTRFGEMEKAMTQFNGTKTLLENFTEAWKKQK